MSLPCRISLVSEQRHHILIEPSFRVMAVKSNNEQCCQLNTSSGRRGLEVEHNCQRLWNVVDEAFVDCRYRKTSMIPSLSGRSPRPGISILYGYTLLECASEYSMAC